MVSFIINTIIVISSVISLWIIWQIFRITKSSGFFCLLIAILWMVGIRLLNLLPEPPRTVELVLVFWLLFPVGMYRLLSAIRKTYNFPRHSDEQKDKKK
jgi:hypothetical protein